MAEPSDCTDTTAAALQALQVLHAGEAPQREPLRFHHVSALARRTAGLAGPVRQLLETRLAAALADLQQRLALADITTPTLPSAHRVPSSAAPTPGPLASLLRRQGSVDSAAPPPELQAVQRFAGTWAQLRVDQQLRRALTRQPDNAGPLNSQRLVLQTLQQLRGLSPAYLQRFMAHAEALLWLQDSAPTAAAAPGKRSDTERPRRPTRRGKP